MLLIILSVVGYFLLYKKQKEFYIIEKVDVKAVMLIGDSVRGYNIMPLKSEMGASNWGISVKLSKEYIPGENSPRILFGGTMEPGISGAKSKINRFDVVMKEGDKAIILNDSLFAGEYGSKDSINLRDAIYHLYDNNITLSQFIADVNNNVKYTKGMSFDNWEIYFWFNKRSSEMYTT